MPEINPTIPVVGFPHTTEDPKTRAALITIRNAINGNLDMDNWTPGSVEASSLDDDLAKSVGIDNGSVSGRDYDFVATSQGTTSSSYTDLATAGPSITLDVPTDGFVLLYAEASITGPSTGSSIVGIYEATDFPSSQLVLLQLAGASGTRKTVPGSISGTDTVGGFITLPATAGSRTYTLKYARYLGTGTATFASRKLWGMVGGP